MSNPTPTNDFDPHGSADGGWARPMEGRGMGADDAAEPSAALESMRAAVTVLQNATAVDATGMGGRELLEYTALTEQAGRLIDGARVTTAGEVAHRSRYELGDQGLSVQHGHAKAVHLLETVTRCSGAELFRRMRLGLLLRGTDAATAGLVELDRFTAAKDALRAGTIDVEAAGKIVHTLAKIRGANPDDVQEALLRLLESAHTTPTDSVSDQVIVWREALDPDGAAPRDEIQRARRGMRLGKENEHGMSRLVCDVTPKDRALLVAMMAEADAAQKPRFLPTDELPGGSAPGGSVPADQSAGDGVPADQLPIDDSPVGTLDDDTGMIVLGEVADTRTREQRHYDTLMGTVHAGVQASQNELGETRSTATITAVATIADLEAGVGVGWLDGVDEPVSIPTILQLACGNRLQKMVLGNSGEILYLGAKPRLFNAAQKRALAVRDGGCGVCGAPPRQCEAHHIVEYSRGGPTDIDNAVLLCEAHHHWVHSSPFTIRMIRGRPHLLAPPWMDPNQQWTPMGHARAIAIAALNAERSRRHSLAA